MEKIYKYTSLESAIKILESNAVALNNPQNYNDPFDSVIDFDDDDVEKSISIVVEYYLIQEFFLLSYHLHQDIDTRIPQIFL